MSALDSLEPLWELGELPFHIGPNAQPSNGSLPDRLPFTVGIDTRSGRIVQMPNPVVERALEEAYSRGSRIGTPLADTGSGEHALADFLGFLERTLGRDRLDGLSVLELGSGGGAILHALHRRGASVIGVEPGPQPEAGPPVPVIREPFRATLFAEPFDLILHHAVAEHVADPVTFMAEQLMLLKPGGMIVFTVPDCAAPLAHGDISILIHEHWSYFTEGTLAALASLAGARVVHTEPAGAAGARHSCWVAAEAPVDTPSPSEPTSFVASASGNLERLRGHMCDLRGQGARLGVFCPGRFINYEYLLRDSLPPLRYFDDDPLLEGLCYPPSPVRIESRRALAIDPPSHVVVFSWTFGDGIVRSLRADPLLDDVDIRTVADLLDSSRQTRCNT